MDDVAGFGDPPEGAQAMEARSRQRHADRERQRRVADDNPTPAGGRQPSPPTSTSSGRQMLALPRSASDAADEGAGVILGLALYALGLAYYRYGAAGVHSWLSAKFINKPTLGSAGGVGAAAAKLPPPPHPNAVPGASIGAAAGGTIGNASAVGQTRGVE